MIKLISNYCFKFKQNNEIYEIEAQEIYTHHQIIEYIKYIALRRIFVEDIYSTRKFFHFLNIENKNITDEFVYQFNIELCNQMGYTDITKKDIASLVEPIKMNNVNFYRYNNRLFNDITYNIDFKKTSFFDYVIGKAKKYIVSNSEIILSVFNFFWYLHDLKFERRSDLFLELNQGIVECITNKSDENEKTTENEKMIFSFFQKNYLFYYYKGFSSKKFSYFRYINIGKNEIISIENFYDNIQVQYCRTQYLLNHYNNYISFFNLKITENFTVWRNWRKSLKNKKKNEQFSENKFKLGKKI